MSPTPEEFVDPLTGATPEEGANALGGAAKTYLDWRRAGGMGQYLHPEDPTGFHPEDWIGPHMALGGMFGGEQGARRFPGYVGRGRISEFEHAQAMERSGADRGSIWDQTGWYRAPDRQWKFEIDDSTAKYDPLATLDRDLALRHKAIDDDPTISEGAKEAMKGQASIKTNNYKREGGFRGPVRAFFDHPELYAAYPEVGRVQFRVVDLTKFGYAPSVIGVASPPGVPAGERFVALDPKVAFKEEGRLTLLHELQHIVQGIEGFGMGYSVPGMEQLITTGLMNRFSRKRAASTALTPPPKPVAEMTNGEYREYTERRDANYEASLSPEERAQRKQFVADSATLSRAPEEYGRLGSWLGYRATAGEAEAFNVEARAGLSSIGRKMKPPWKTDIIPGELQIVIDNRGKIVKLEPHSDDPFQGQQPDRRLAPVEHNPFTHRLESVEHDPFAEGEKPSAYSGVDSEAAKTGRPEIDQVLDNKITNRNINDPKLDREHSVQYTAGGSTPLENPEMFIDHRFPREFTVNGITFDPARPFAVHENIEQHVMEELIKAGWPKAEAYQVAHWHWAEQAEGAWYKAHGIDQRAAEAAYEPYIRTIQHEPSDRPNPPKLYRDPYPHDNPSTAGKEPYEEPKPSAELVARAIATLRSRGLIK